MKFTILGIPDTRKILRGVLIRGFSVWTPFRLSLPRPVVSTPRQAVAQLETHVLPAAVAAAGNSLGKRRRAGVAGALQHAERDRSFHKQTPQDRQRMTAERLRTQKN